VVKEQRYLEEAEEKAKEELRLLQAECTYNYIKINIKLT
jgi:hypothetical protein